MNVLILLTDKQYAFLLGLADKARVDVSDVAREAMMLGAEQLQSRHAPTPPTLAERQALRLAYGPINQPKKLRLVK